MKISSHLIRLRWIKAVLQAFEEVLAMMSQDHDEKFWKRRRQYYSLYNTFFLLLKILFHQSLKNLKTNWYRNKDIITTIFHTRVKSAHGSFIKLSNPNWSGQINFWQECPKSDQTRIKMEDTMYLRPFIRLWEISGGEIMVMFCNVTSKVIFWRQGCSMMFHRIIWK